MKCMYFIFILSVFNTHSEDLEVLEFQFIKLINSSNFILHLILYHIWRITSHFDTRVHDNNYIL